MKKMSKIKNLNFSTIWMPSNKTVLRVNLCLSCENMLERLSPRSSRTNIRQFRVLFSPLNTLSNCDTPDQNKRGNPSKTINKSFIVNLNHTFSRELLIYLSFNVQIVPAWSAFCFYDYFFFFVVDVVGYLLE